MKMDGSPDDVPSAVDDMRDDYDFLKMEGVVRGKYTDAYKKNLRIVRLAEDIAPAFPTEAAVNDALRVYLRDHSIVPN
jgi:hypothetical protein